ncbi:MAG: hypothetical protein ACLPKB_35490 [Xanthobacteraceae bacterium]
MPDKETLIATVGTPNDAELGKAIDRIQAEISSRKLRAMTVTVVTELVSNLRDHGKPAVGKVRVYLQEDHAIRVVSEGEANAFHMKALVKKIEDIVNASSRTEPLLGRLAARTNRRRVRGRGLYWVAENSSLASLDGRPDLNVSRRGSHFVISATLKPLVSTG